jgi:hypothetical protein
MTDPNYTALLIVLDRSGSMSSIRDDMVGGLEQMLAAQATEPGILTVDIVTFDDVIEHTHSFASPADVRVELVPRGSTALHDAMGISINSFGQALADLPERARPSSVQVIVVTDGMENASQEYSAKTVRELVTQQIWKYGWDFVFLGADQDAVLTAADLGIRADKAMSYARGKDNIAAMSSSVAAQVRHARGHVFDVGFSEEERSEALRPTDAGQGSGLSKS